MLLTFNNIPANTVHSRVDVYDAIECRASTLPSHVGCQGGNGYITIITTLQRPTFAHISVVRPTKIQSDGAENVINI